jgi:hypothetical protein
MDEVTNTVVYIVLIDLNQLDITGVLDSRYNRRSQKPLEFIPRNSRRRVACVDPEGYTRSLIVDDANGAIPLIGNRVLCLALVLKRLLAPDRDSSIWFEICDAVVVQVGERNQVRHVAR